MNNRAKQLVPGAAVKEFVSNPVALIKLFLGQAAVMENRFRNVLDNVAMDLVMALFSLDSCFRMKILIIYDNMLYI